MHMARTTLKQPFLCIQSNGQVHVDIHPALLIIVLTEMDLDHRIVISVTFK